MIGSDNKSRNGTERPREVLQYAAPSTQRPFEFAGATATLALVAAWVCLLPVLMTLTNGVAPKGRILFLLFPLAAVILAGIPFLDAQLSPAARRRARTAMWLGGAELVVMLVAAAVVPGWSMARINRHGCQTNLRGIATALSRYSREHGGMYPPSFDELLLTNFPYTRSFVCPGSDDRAVNGGTADTLIREFHQPGSCSYVYALGSIPASSVTPAHVVAYEGLSNHQRQGSGMHVVYGNGGVVWLDAPAAGHLIAELQAGHNPPRPVASEQVE